MQRNSCLRRMRGWFPSVQKSRRIGRDGRARLGVELLEARETPAGALTASVAAGVLTINGDDDNNVFTLKVTASDVTITPDAATSVNGEAAGTAVIIAKSVTGLKVSLRGGNDSFSIDNAADFKLSGAANIDMGDGNNTVNLITSGQLELGSLTIIGGDGEDDVTAQAAGSKISGSVVLKYGVGGSHTNFVAIDVFGAGGINLSAGEGDDEFTANFVDVSKAFVANTGNGVGLFSLRNGKVGSLTVSASDAGINLSDNDVGGPVKVTGAVNASVNFENDSTISGSVTVAASGSDDDSHVNIINSNVLGSVTATHAGEKSEMRLNATNAIVQGPIVVRNTGANSGAVLVGDAATLNGTVGLFATGPGDSEALSEWTNVSTSGALTMRGTRSATMEVNGGKLTVSGDIIGAAGHGSARMTMNGGALVARNISLSGIEDTEFLLAGPLSSLSLTGNFSLTTLGEGALQADDRPVNIAGSVTVSGGHQARIESQGTFTAGRTTVNGKNFEGLLLLSGDVVTINGDLSVTGKGQAEINITPNTSADLKGNVTMTGGAGGDDFMANSLTTFRKNVTMNLGAGGNSIRLGDNSLTTWTQVLGNLQITTGDGGDEIEIRTTKVTGTTRILSGAGADSLLLDRQSSFTGAFHADTGAGDDSIRVAQDDEPGITAPVTFTGKATILGGNGNDHLELGLSPLAGGNANTMAVFVAAGSKIDLGAGLNLFDDELGQFSGIALGTGIVNVVDPTP